MIEKLEAMLAKGTDNALLRFTLGNAYRQAGDIERSLEHLARALEHDPQYSAAWKAYAGALAHAGCSARACTPARPRARW